MPATRSMVVPKSISPGVAYSIEEAMERLGCGAATIRRARRHGLLIRRFGRRSFVLGKDLIAYLEDKCAYVGPDGKARLPK